MKKPSLAEPVTELRRVPIRENGEPLVDFIEFCPELLIDVPRFEYKRQRLARRTVAEMICKANETLMSKGYKLAIIEGWRPPHIQRRMYLANWNRFKERHPDWSDVQLRRTVNRFTAPIHGKVPPPHTTGGAVDLVLATIDGKQLDHSSPYSGRDPAAFPFDAPKLSSEARKHRDLVAEALLPTGITNYPSEYWHWSYGDQGWAYRGGHEAALYGPVTPPNWEPDPAEAIEEPLVFIYNPS